MTTPVSSVKTPYKLYLNLKLKHQHTPSLEKILATRPYINNNILYI